MCIEVCEWYEYKHTQSVALGETKDTINYTQCKHRSHSQVTSTIIVNIYHCCPSERYSKQGKQHDRKSINQPV